MTIGTPQHRINVFISAHEWSILQDLRYFALGRDEREPDAHFLLECRGEDRVWSGGNSRLQLTYRTTAPANVDNESPFSTAIHSRFFPWDAPKDLTLQLDVGGCERHQTMTGLGFALTLPEPIQRESGWRKNPMDVRGQRVIVEREALERAAAHASSVPLGASDEGETAAYVRVSNGQLEFKAPWPGFGATTTTITLDGTYDDTEPVLIFPRTLAVLADRTTDGTITLRIPDDANGDLAVITTDFEAVFTPIDRFATNRRELEQRLCELLGTDGVTADDDGDYPITTADGHHIWVRLKTSWTPLTVEVFGVLAADVEHTDAVMREINLINTSCGYVRAMWHSGQVIVAVDLLEDDLDLSELKNSLDIITGTVDRYQPLFASFFTSVDEPPQLPGIE
ncbi:MAG: hypothetical protein O2815_04480 [Actinomycetota bacterium]|nr:hypothetical protein [Actinomycetota bacterium]